ncbi:MULTISPECIES: hypothetical protein [unclassified Streptomyces]|uniref:hypothetical protein n=1 Tax=unclassified Streptomyces TaxID=2593676 RepID=UPI00344AA737
MASRGRSNARIAAKVGVHVDTVRTWRGPVRRRRPAGPGLPTPGRPTWPPTTSTGRRSSAAARPPPASHRSWPWSNRS